MDVCLFHAASAVLGGSGQPSTGVKQITSQLSQLNVKEKKTLEHKKEKQGRKKHKHKGLPSRCCFTG